MEKHKRKLLDICSRKISRILQLFRNKEDKESNSCANCKSDEKQVGDIWIPPKIQIRNAGTQTEESDDVDNNLSKDIEDDFYYGDMSTIQAQWVKEEDDNEEWRKVCHKDKKDINIQKTKTGDSNFILHPKQEFVVKYRPDIDQVQIHTVYRSPFPVWYPPEVIKNDRYKPPILHDDELLSIQRYTTPENSHTPTSLILKNATLVCDGCPVTMVIRHLSYNGMSVVWIKLSYKGKIFTVVVLLNAALQLKHVSDELIPETTVCREKDFFADAEIRNVVVVMLNCPLEFRNKTRTVVELLIERWQGKAISFCMEARIHSDDPMEYKIPELSNPFQYLQTQNSKVIERWQGKAISFCMEARIHSDDAVEHKTPELAHPFQDLQKQISKGATGHAFKNGIICKNPKLDMPRGTVSGGNQPGGIEQPDKCQLFYKDVNTRKLKMGFGGAEARNGLEIPCDTGKIQTMPSQEVIDKNYVSVDPGDMSIHHGTKYNTHAVIDANPTSGVGFANRCYGLKRNKRKVVRKKKGDNPHINSSTDMHNTFQKEAGIDASQMDTRKCDELHKKDDRSEQGATGFKKDIDSCRNTNGIIEASSGAYCRKKKRSKSAKVKEKCAKKPSTCSNGLDGMGTYGLSSLYKLFDKILTSCWVVVLISMLLPITAADPKPQSMESARNVTRCPTQEEWLKVSIIKNCSRYSSESKLQYHCVLNDERTGFVELCSPVVEIMGEFCAEYNRGLQRIQPQTGTSCEGVCPFAYNSTDMIKYPECYQIFRNDGSTDSGFSMSTPGKQFEENGTTLKQPPGDQKSGCDGGACSAPIIYIIIGCCILFVAIIIFIVFYKCCDWRSKQSNLCPRATYVYGKVQLHLHRGKQDAIEV